MDPGKKVAALVPYQKKSPPEWIGTCTVRDDVPENRKQAEWTIPATRVVEFPLSQEQLDQRTFERNETVLSLWYLTDIRDWSSMFYEAQVMSVAPNGHTLQLAFKGDNAIVPTPREKVLQLPKTEITVPGAEEAGQRRSHPSGQPQPKVPRVEVEPPVSAPTVSAKQPAVMNVAQPRQPPASIGPSYSKQTEKPSQEINQSPRAEDATKAEAPLEQKDSSEVPASS
ncbi:hypothetical protein GEMRC1_003211 [Eukaryota sp. GEM-RC1]